MSKILRYDEDGNSVWVEKRDAYKYATNPPKAMVSSALGVTIHNVNEVREDARRHGFSAIEFKPDPALIEDGVALWYDCHCSCPDQFRRYTEHCRLFDKTSGREGFKLSPETLAEAERLTLRAYPRTPSDSG